MIHSNRVVRFCIAAGAAVILAGAAALSASAAVDPANPDWPCVQRKVERLTSAQLWDGPPVDDMKNWSTDATVADLAKFLITRRVSLDEAEAAIKKFAEAQPEAERDAKLTQLFAGVLALTNQERKIIIDGIERFQRRQVARAKELERQGEALAKAGQQMSTLDQPVDHKTPEQERYDWDARVFQERQQNLPIACELPTIVEQRAFEVGRLIRAEMKN